MFLSAELSNHLKMPELVLHFSYFGMLYRYDTSSSFTPANLRSIAGEKKVFVCFEGCDPKLHGTVLLRGGPKQQLKLVKNLLRT